MDTALFYAIYLLVSVGLNLQMGYTGLPNFGIVLSVAGGAYTVGWFVGRFAMMIYNIKGMDFINDNAYLVTQINSKLANDPLTAIIIFLMTIGLVIMVGTALGFITAYPAIRLSGDYLTMTLMAMAEAVRVIGIGYSPIAGGTLGVQVPDLFAWMGKARYFGVITLIFATSIIVFLIVQLITSSPFGRLLRAVRDNEVTAESIGKNVVDVRIKAMILGSIIASLAGALYSFYASAVIPAAFTRYDWTFWAWLIIMVGGAGNNLGVAVGTLLVVLVRRLITFYKFSLAAFLPFEPLWLELIGLGLVLILIMIFRPQGILAEKPTRIRGVKSD
ncbi:MAG: branched-chain amino acid ABC transporter permease [Candidatus Bathyarchaeia archaeon]